MIKTFPAPLGGLNRRDPLSAMAPTDALVLENLIPRRGYLTPRDRFDQVINFQDADVLNVVPDFVGGMMQYNNDVLIPVSDGGGRTALYNIDNDAFIAAEAGHAAFTNYTIPITLSVPIPTEIDARGLSIRKSLIITGVGAKPVVYDGFTINNLTVTSGMTSLEESQMNRALIFKGRAIYYSTAANSDYWKFWYAEAGSYQGVFNSFDISSFIDQSAYNYVAAITTWSADTGEGRDDFLVIVMYNGEALVY